MTASRNNLSISFKEYLLDFFSTKFLLINEKQIIQKVYETFIFVCHSHLEGGYYLLM